MRQAAAAAACLLALNGTPGLKLGSRGAGGGEFGWADGVAYGPSGELAVVDWGNHRVQAFHPNGTLAFKVGSRGAADGQFYWPSGVAYGPSGELAVADSGNHRVQAFHPNGTLAFKVGSRGAADGQFFYPAGVAYGPSGEVGDRELAGRAVGDAGRPVELAVGGAARTKRMIKHAVGGKALRGAYIEYSGKVESL